MLEFRLLRADEIDARISQCNSWGVQLLLYKDARCDQNILDETVGAMNWMRHHSRDNANCVVSIWDESKSQWIEKEDTGTESNTEAAKGLASDSFKRACFNWGIGRELYTAPAIFVRANDLKTLEEKSGRWTCRDIFAVTDISYEGRKIASVEIKNNKTSKLLTFRNEPVKSTTKSEPLYTRAFLEAHGKETIGPAEVSTIMELTRDKTGNESLDAILKSCKKASVKDLDYLQFISITNHFKAAA